MATITISGEDFYSYSSVADADIYLIPNQNFTIWDAKTPDQKGSYLIQSTRFLDTLDWIDDYNTQVLREAVPEIVAACQEIAALFATGETSWTGNEAPSDSTKKLKAGSAEIEFASAKPWFANGSRIQWPSSIYRLLQDCLSSKSSALGVGAASFGTDGVAGDSAYDGDYGLVN